MVSPLRKELVYPLRANSLESSIGNTPLMRLQNVVADLRAGVAVFVKAEHLNPGGSVKDRPALQDDFGG